MLLHWPGRDVRVTDNVVALTWQRHQGDWQCCCTDLAETSGWLTMLLTDLAEMLGWLTMLLHWPGRDVRVTDNVVALTWQRHQGDWQCCCTDLAETSGWLTMLLTDLAETLGWLTMLLHWPGRDVRVTDNVVDWPGRDVRVTDNVVALTWQRRQGDWQCCWGMPARPAVYPPGSCGRSCPWTIALAAVRVGNVETNHAAVMEKGYIIITSHNFIKFALVRFAHLRFWWNGYYTVKR